MKSNLTSIAGLQDFLSGKSNKYSVNELQAITTAPIRPNQRASARRGSRPVRRSNAPKRRSKAPKRRRKK